MTRVPSEHFSPENSQVSPVVEDIPGWSVDADPQNDPTYPMRDRSRDDGPGRNWERPLLQPQHDEVLLSIEHTRRPAVFGSSTPPSGLSGELRRKAFAFSESQWAHWLLLMAADRVNVIEGLAQDLSRGRIPNLFHEMGLGAELKYNREAFLRKTAITAGVVGAVGILLWARSGRRRR